MVRKLWSILVIFVLISCNSANQDNTDGGDNNFKFSPEQLGQISFDIKSVNFGNVVLNGEKKRVISITNIGKIPLRFPSGKKPLNSKGEEIADAEEDIIQLFGEDKFNNAFSFSGDTALFPGEGGTCQAGPNVELEAGKSCEIVLSFKPTNQKSDSINLKIFYYNGLDKVSTELSLEGYGGSEAALEFSNSAIDFGNVDQSTSLSQIITITNSGGLTARDFIVSIRQNQDDQDRDLFSIDPAGTTCPLIASALTSGASCQVKINAVSNFDQTYLNYRGFLDFNFKYDPAKEDINTETLDIFMHVVSLEAILSVSTATQNFGDFVDGAITQRSISIQNTGFNTAILQTPQVSGDNGTISFPNLIDCINRDDETIIGGFLHLPMGHTCIINMNFAPELVANAIALPGDFSSSSIHFDYDNNKTGIQSTDAFSIDATVIAPAKIEIQGAIDPVHEVWALSDVFVANDLRFQQQITYTLENTGEKEAKSLSVIQSSNDFVSHASDCGTTLGTGETCSVTVTMNPHISLYSAMTSLATNINFNYQDGTSINVTTPFVASTLVEVTGNLDLRSELVFSDFDSITSGSATSVAGSSGFFDISITNIGQQTESNFALVITQPTNFIIIDDVGLPTINGEKNCGLHDTGSGTLMSGERCTYRIRTYSASVGDIIENLTLQFNGSDISDPFELTGSFVNGAQIELDTPLPSDRVAVKTYAAGSYPGPGTSTSVNDASLSRRFNPNAIDETYMSFPSLPVGMNVDLGLIEAGYYSNSASQTISFEVQNNGGFSMEIRDLSIVEQRNETSGTPIASGGPWNLPLNSGTCFGGSVTNTVSVSSNCNAEVVFTPSDGDLYSVRVQVQYTTGVKISPTSNILQVFTSEFTVLSQGFDSSIVASIAVTSPVLVAGAVPMEAIFGGLNIDNQDIIITNSGSVNATDIHYQFIESGASWDITDTGGRLSITAMSLAASPIDTYYRLGVSECSGAVADQIASSGGTCTMDTTFLPDAADEKLFAVTVRYFNGVTYLSENFNINTKGITPAKVIVRNLSGNDPSYTYDFGIQPVEGNYAFEVELFNSGDTDATLLTLPIAPVSFDLISSVTSSPGCGATLVSKTRCYLTLSYNPTYSVMETDEVGGFNINYDNGWIVMDGSNIQNFDIEGSGFSEEKHSSHQGWAEIESYGLNAAYATILGAPYEADDLGYIRLVWNPMADENGPHANTIDSYDILKSTINSFDIHNDTAYTNITVAGGETEFEFIDDNINNTPGSVWYYYIVPIRSGRRSRVVIQDYPISSIRVAIPYAYSSLLHKYMKNMEICRHMGIDVNDPTNIDLSNNGCRFSDHLGDPQVYSSDYDLQVDMHEATIAYLNGTNGHTNEPGEVAATSNFDNALDDCNDISVSFPGQSGILSGSHNKTLLTRDEHFILSMAASSPYITEDCRAGEGGVVTTGDGVDCISKFQLEYAVGGFPEWTTTQLDGLSRGEITNYHGFYNNDLVGTDFSFTFISPIIGQNQILLASDTNGVSGACFDPSLGLLVPKVSGNCGGEKLKDMTLDSGLADSETIYLGDEAVSSKFAMFKFSQASNPFTVNALAGGGDQSGTFQYFDNYSPYTTDFNVSPNPNGGVRCTLRLGY